MHTTNEPLNTPPPVPPQGQASKGAHILGGERDHSGPGPEVMAAETLQGDIVVNSEGDELGKLSDIMLDVRSGRIAYAVLAFGGVLGVGNKLFAIPWHALTLDTARHCFILHVDKKRLENAPGFDKNHWPAMAEDQWASDLHAYYGAKPYWQDRNP